MRAPREIVEVALRKGELVQLLLGHPDYRYQSRWSPTAMDTDLVDLLSALYELVEPTNARQVWTQYHKAILNLVDEYDGLIPVAVCIALEALRRKTQRVVLDLPLEDLARRLWTSIEQHRDRLRSDRRGPGAQWPDGLLGELRHLSQVTVDADGPRFFV